MCKINTVLVTSGAGFIGSAVVRQFINETDITVVNVDALTYAGNLESLESVSDNPRYFFEQADICDRAAMERIFREYQPDAIMHLAAESHVDRSIEGPAEFTVTRGLPPLLPKKRGRERSGIGMTVYSANGSQHTAYDYARFKT